MCVYSGFACIVVWVNRMCASSDHIYIQFLKFIDARSEVLVIHRERNWYSNYMSLLAVSEGEKMC